jgi:hypothetical protein
MGIPDQIEHRENAKEEAKIGQAVMQLAHQLIRISLLRREIVVQ